MLAATFSTSAAQVHEALIVLESADPALERKPTTDVGSYFLSRNAAMGRCNTES